MSEVLSAKDQEIATRADALVRSVGGDPDAFDGRLVREMIVSALRFEEDNADTLSRKIMSATMKELRYAFRIFSDYRHIPKVSIFGSARTPEGHPDYERAVEFSREIASAGWMVITGAGDGIMKAGHVGPGRGASFGVAIRLPFETSENEVISGDEKLIRFRYFFTRKLMFMSQSDAVVLCPGGFGTQDEGFEALTLIQTGKGQMIPVVMLEGEGGDYWRHWDNYVRRSLLDYGMISPEDLNLYYLASSVDDAVKHILHFYRIYHSSRYVRDDLVIRLKRPLGAAQVELLNERFSALVADGSIRAVDAYDAETDHRDLPRIAFHHKRGQYGLLRAMIDQINDFVLTPAPSRRP